MNRFDKNLRYFERHNSKASALLSLADLSCLRFSKTERGEEILVRGEDPYH